MIAKLSLQIKTASKTECPEAEMPEC